MIVPPCASLAPAGGGGACDSPILPDKPNTLVYSSYCAILTGGAAAAGAKPPKASGGIINGFLKEHQNAIEDCSSIFF
jgi:hypothetical protein